ISALISEHCFEDLDAPIKRVAGLETPIPFAADLEREYLANDRFDNALKELIAY
ncbi:MAG: transketolase C-terminal domain-containing protein, partial [Patiriisocius sp.]